jgi:hypothetical protein
MSMSLNTEALLDMAAKVREIENINVKVTEFLVADHRVMLAWDDRNKPYVVGIMRSTEPKSHGNLRPTINPASSQHPVHRNT